MWLIREDILRQMREARSAGIKPTADEQRAHEERIAARSNGPRSLALAGDVAEIRVEGVLTKKPDFWSWLLGLGNTTYSDMLEAIAVAQTDPNVKSVRLFVDSPGGQADGLFDVLHALDALKKQKPVAVRAANAYSAAYGIAAVAGPIEAQNAASMFGSVGVAASFMLWDDVVDLTNTESPDKRPDLSTEEGRAVVVRELDAIFDLFVAAIASGRNTSREDVVENFGRGASFVAGDAKKRGMIDKVARPALRVVAETTTAPEMTGAAEGSAAAHQTNPSAGVGGTRKARAMNLEELRSQHPDTYRAAVQEGVTQGTTAERDRVVAHLTMGEASGDMPTAAAAIRSGDTMTATLQAKYLAAGMNRADRRTRQQESDEAGKVVDPAAATAPTTQPDLGAQVVALLEQRRGKS